MDFTFLTEYFVPVVAGICLCVGYIIKMWTPADNKYIPTVCAVLGVILSTWMNGWVFTPQIVMTGLFSGLASTGLYEAFRNLIGNKE